MSHELSPLGRMLMLFGLVLFLAGLAVAWGPNVPWLGRLPGDIAIRRDGFAFYLPLTSSIVVSLLVSLFLWIGGRFK